MKNSFLRLAVILLAVALGTAGLMGNTFAKYTETVSGTDSARVAHFDFDAEGLGADGTVINLFNTVYDPQVAGTNPENKGTDGVKLLAPGTSGYFDLRFTDKSEVATILACTIDETNVGITLDGDTVATSVPIIYSIITAGVETFYSSLYDAAAVNTFSVIMPEADRTQVTSVTLTGNLDNMATALSVARIEPGTLYSTYNNTVKWYWAFEQPDGAEAAAYDTTTGAQGVILGKDNDDTAFGDYAADTADVNVTFLITFYAVQLD